MRDPQEMRRRRGRMHLMSVLVSVKKGENRGGV